MTTSIRSRVLSRLALLAAGFLVWAPPAVAQSAGTGAIQGRVVNPETGENLERARITVDGTQLETFTDSTGLYRLPQVPAGTANVKAFRTGTAPQTATVTVTAGQITQHDFQLVGLAVSRSAAASGGDAVKLDAFVVSSLKEMAGAAIAINTQRFAPNVMNVIAADEFGPMATGNVGEVLKTLPGVQLGLGGLGEPNTISMNGVPSRNVPVTFGGFNFANANGSAQRFVGIHQVSLNNISRIEVSYTPTPETPGSALAGTVNMVPRSAFERSKPVFNTSVSLLMREKESSFGKTPGPRTEPTRKIKVGADFSAIVPVGKRLGFTLSASTSPLYTEQFFTQSTWRGLAAATNGTTLPDTTPDRPYLTDFAVRDATRLSTHTAYGATFDYRLTEHDRVTFTMNYALFDWQSNDRTMTFFVNSVAPGNFGPTFTRGAPGAGEVRQANAAQDVNDTLYMPTFIWRHDGPVWRAEAGAGLSHSTRLRRDLDHGYFFNALANRTGVTISFDQITPLRPGAITVTDAAGTPIDPYDIDTYSLVNGTGMQISTTDLQRSAFANARRSFYGRVPLTLKAGLDVRQNIRDIRADNPTFTYNAANRSASQFYDEGFSVRYAPYGFPQIQWLDSEAIGRFHRANPELFTLNLAGRHNQAVALSKHAEEVLSSGYLRGDAQFLEGKLKVVGGVRMEQTNVKGEGAMTDPAGNFQRDASGNIVRGPNGQPLTQAGTPLEIAQRTAIDRGLRVEKEYLRWFPSLNGSYNVRENLIARAGYYQSVGRPDFDQYAGSLTLPNTANLPGPANRIVVNNPAIKAWSAHTFKATLEYYFEQVGLISVAAFRRDLKNFFATVVTAPTPEFLSRYDLDPDVYGGYEMQTQHNLPSTVRMTGIELNYKQALTFLPYWARGVQVFGNASALRATGEGSENFAGYAPRTGNWGISLSRPKYNLRVRWNHLSRQRLSTVAAGRSIDDSVYTWNAKRTVVDVNAEYYFYKKFAVFTNFNNINDAPVDVEISGPRTPDYAKFRQRQQFGAQWLFGVKATF